METEEVVQPYLYREIVDGTFLREKFHMAGNRTKYISYRRAYERIALSIEHGFFLEAIAIEESIISDRLRSFVSYVQNAEIGDHVPFGKIVVRWINNLNKDNKSKDENRWDYDENLLSDVKTWVDRRNFALHSIVKSQPGTATMDIEEFLIESEKTARMGSRLSRMVSDWSKAQIKRETGKG